MLKLSKTIIIPYYSFNLKAQLCKLYNKNTWSLQQKQRVLKISR